MPQTNPAASAPSPTPAPVPTPLPTRGLVDDLYALPVLRELPFRGVLTTLTEILLLLLLFVVLRAILRRVVRNASNAVIAREENGGNFGRAQRIRTLTGLGLSVATYVLGFIVLLSMLGTVGVN